MGTHFYSTHFHQGETSLFAFKRLFHTGSDKKTISHSSECTSSMYICSRRSSEDYKGSLSLESDFASRGLYLHSYAIQQRVLNSQSCWYCTIDRESHSRFISVLHTPLRTKYLAPSYIHCAADLFYSSLLRNALLSL